jgi:hypothetical protein
MNTKKLITFLMAASLCLTTAFAQETDSAPFRVSVGGGGLVSGNFSTWSVDESQPGSLYRYNSTHLNTAPFLFFDLKYLELNFGLLLGQMNAASAMSDDPNFPAKTLGLRGGAYLKLPFAISPMFTLFPLLGVDYDLYLLAKKDDDRDAKFPVSSSNQNAKAIDALNTLWFKAGIGWDTFFTDNLFLRTEVLYGLRLPNKMEKHLQDTRQDSDKMLGHGGDFKIAIGYRF